jgi:hypothetical protein
MGTSLAPQRTDPNPATWTSWCLATDPVCAAYPEDASTAQALASILTSIDTIITTHWTAYSTLTPTIARATLAEGR